MQERLTEKQRRFVEAYMGEAMSNATESARIAGYRGNRATLASVGRENLRKPQIRTAIDQRVHGDPAIAGRHERQQFWTSVVHDSNQRMADRLRASELLARSQGDFAEQCGPHEPEPGFKTVVYYPDNGRGLVVPDPATPLVGG